MKTKTVNDLFLEEAMNDSKMVSFSCLFFFFGGGWMGGGGIPLWY